MSNNSFRSKQFNQVSLIVMGFIWIAFALFGLIFDPEKRLIIISQIVAGALCFFVFIVLKLKKT
jgi:hypothetical protein